MRCLIRFWMTIYGLLLLEQQDGHTGGHVHRNINNFSIDIYTFKGFY